MKYFDDCRLPSVHSFFSAVLCEDSDYFDYDHRI